MNKIWNRNKHKQFYDTRYYPACVMYNTGRFQNLVPRLSFKQKGELNMNVSAGIN
jgi:hypothetical protein